MQLASHGGVLGNMRVFGCAIGILLGVDAVEICFKSDVVEKIANLIKLVPANKLEAKAKTVAQDIQHTGRVCQRLPPVSNQQRWPPNEVVIIKVLGFCLNSSYGSPSLTAI